MWFFLNIHLILIKKKKHEWKFSKLKYHIKKSTNRLKVAAKLEVNWHVETQLSREINDHCGTVEKTCTVFSVIDRFFGNLTYIKHKKKGNLGNRLSQGTSFSFLRIWTKIKYWQDKSKYWSDHPRNYMNIYPIL